MESLPMTFLENFWRLLSSIAPYILVGIFLAGLMKLLIREEWIRKQMGEASLKNSLKAILLGIPLPLCSCSVIPFATALRQAGASRSSTLSFLIATPITGVDSIAATYGVLGWFFTLYRVLSSVFIALLAGVLSLLFDREESPAKPGTRAAFTAAPGPAPLALPFPPGLAGVSPSAAEEGESCGSGSCCGTMEEESEGARSWLTRLWNEAVHTVFGDFARALLLGIALGALIVTFMPEELGTYLGENLWLNYLLVIAVAAPLYICATSSIPLGVALLAAGVSTGAVFVFLTAGPASSTVTMSVVKKVLGTRSLIFYLVAVFSGTLLFGYLFDTLFADQAAWVRTLATRPEAPGFLSQISAVLLLMLSWRVLFPSKKIKKSGCCA
jgi:uncharacterized membrane protein YraQ (UPF0718 family)